MPKKLTYGYVKSQFEKDYYIPKFTEYINSKTKLDYICDKGHQHSINWSDWSQGKRCPICAGRPPIDLIIVKKSFEKEGYKLLSTEYINNKTKLWYICPQKNKHYITWSDWCSGYRCPCCSGRPIININIVKKSFETDSYIVISEEYTSAKEPLISICPNNHEYKVSWDNWNSKGYRCPKCSGHGISKQEKEVYNFMLKITEDKILENNRTLIAPQELDMVIPEKKVAVEYCGLYWHSDIAGKGRKYHLDKLKSIEEKGYRLITIFEDEWVLKPEIVKSRLSNILGGKNLTKVHARKCIIKEISPQLARSFCNENHLQGYGSGSRIKLGAFYNNILVSVMTFSKPSLAKGNKVDKIKSNMWELHRFCSKLNHAIPGIASKLLKHFERNYDWNEIFSFADRRWSDGNVYEKIGFTLQHETMPNYWYFKGSSLERTHRFALRKTKDDNPNITEWENRQLAGWNRIWDCGNLKYVKKNL